MYVAYFHSIGNASDKGFIRYLSVPLNMFERFCAFLSDQKFQTYFLDDWYDYVSKNPKKSKNQYALTFDDGYLDNWVYAFPILKRYGLKGTIFVNPEFIDPSPHPRPNLEDVGYDASKIDKSQAVGFLNWAEIETMQASGIIDIQSHSMSHNFYFSSNKLLDVYHGQNRLEWMTWLKNPEGKPFYLSEDYERNPSYGYPIFEFGRALALRRYLPDDALFDKGKAFFNNGMPPQEIKLELEKLLIKYPGRFETDLEMEQRYSYELHESKRVLEEKLKKPVNYLCWPGGGFNDLSVRISKEAGYKASTLGSSLTESEVDNSGEYKRIPRFGLGSGVKVKNGIHHFNNKNHLIQVFKSKTGNLPLKVILKLKREYLRLMKSNY